MCPKLLEVIFPSQLKFTVWKSTMYSFFFPLEGKVLQRIIYFLLHKLRNKY